MKPRRVHLLTVLAAVVVLIILLSFLKLSSVLNSASVVQTEALPKTESSSRKGNRMSDHTQNELEIIPDKLPSPEVAPNQQMRREEEEPPPSAASLPVRASVPPNDFSLVLGFRHAKSSEQSSEVLRILAHKRNYCDAETKLAVNYDFVDRRGVDWAWCVDMAKTHKIQLGLSWGTLSAQDQKTWESEDCNTQIFTGPLHSCSEKYSWQFLNNWMDSVKGKRQTIVEGGSEIVATRSINDNYFYSMRNVVLDASRAVVVEGCCRHFQDGFLTSFGKFESPDPIKNNKFVDPFLHSSIDALNPFIDSTFGFNGFTNKNDTKYSESECEYIETRPVFIVSHDDVYNAAHFMNDVMSVWTMLFLSKKSSSDAVLLNIDGLNYQGASGGVPHRLMDIKHPDTLDIPFIDLYRTMFAEIKSLSHYRGSKVCLREAYVMPPPTLTWIWNAWRLNSNCALKMPSALYQSFNFYLRRSIEESVAGGELILPAAPKEAKRKVHVVLAVRSPPKDGLSEEAKTLARVRIIRNIDDITKSLSTMEGVYLTVQDFAQIDMKAQIALVKSAGMLVSMHGAALAHTLYMSIGTARCCGVVEIFPEEKFGFSDIRGFSNIARNLGAHYSSVQTKEEASEEGTTVSVSELVAAVGNVKSMILKYDGVKYQSSKRSFDVKTCLHDVRIDPLTATSSG